MINTEMLAYLLSELDIYPATDNAKSDIETFLTLLAAWPRSWEPLTEEQIDDLRRALANREPSDRMHLNFRRRPRHEPL